MKTCDEQRKKYVLGRLIFVLLRSMCKSISTLSLLKLRSCKNLSKNVIGEIFTRRLQKVFLLKYESTYSNESPLSFVRRWIFSFLHLQPWLVRVKFNYHSRRNWRLLFTFTLKKGSRGSLNAMELRPNIFLASYSRIIERLKHSSTSSFVLQ